MRKYTVVLPLPPSVNKLYRIRGNGAGMYMTDEGKAWIEDAVLRLNLAKIPLFPAKAKVIVEAEIWWPDNRERDFNNLSKVVCDSIQHASIVASDKQILWREMDFHRPGFNQGEKTGAKSKMAYPLKLIIYEKPIKRPEKP